MSDHMTAEDFRVWCNRNMPEKAFQAHVVEMATSLGWLCYHTWDSRRSQPGFPDLVLVRDRVIFAEIKAEKGRLSTFQYNWISVLKHAGQAVYVWRPSDYETVCEVLK